MSRYSGSHLEYDDESSIGNSIWSGPGSVPMTIPNSSPYSFGVEIELVANPKTIYNSSNPTDFLRKDDTYWRRRLADRMNTIKGLHAVTSRPPRGYDRWYITRDASLLRDPVKYQVALEAVPPKMSQWGSLDREIDNFWKATNAIFDIESNTSCGAHVHVAPFERNYTLMELKKVAYAVATQETLVLQILPQERIGNDYCRPPSVHSEEVANSLLDMRNASQLVEYLQNDRYVLWNFRNTISQSGTIEFRGGRHLDGPVRTKRWVTFALSFIAKAVEDVHLFNGSAETDIDQWWQSIRHHAMDLLMEDFLPGSWTTMRDIVKYS